MANKIDIRVWEIIKAVRSGTKPEEMTPPLTKEWELETYKHYEEEFKKIGKNIAYSPVFD